MKLRDIEIQTSDLDILTILQIDRQGFDNYESFVEAYTSRVDKTPPTIEELIAILEQALILYVKSLNIYDTAKIITYHLQGLCVLEDTDFLSYVHSIGESDNLNSQLETTKQLANNVFNQLIMS